MMLRETVERYCLKKLGRKPNLERPRGYNDLINWLKLYDQMPEQIVCCDKLAVREFAAGRIGGQYILPVMDVGAYFEELFEPKWPCVVKATHDSGSSTIVRDAASWLKARDKIRTALGRTYGVSNGEWAYAFVPKYVLVEPMLPENTDYKFTCSDGVVKWGRIITGRQNAKAVETITDRDGKKLPLHLDEKMIPGTVQPDIPGTWAHMVELAEELARPFRHVRVDLYSSGGCVYFGELTFWPKAGTHRTKDEPIFGEMAEIDLSYKREPIVA